MLTCEEAADRRGAFALGALDENDRREVARHAETCPACRSELESDGEIAALLALAAPNVAPPRSLKAELLATVRTDTAASRSAGTPALPGSDRRVRGWWPRLFATPAPAAMGAAAVASLAFVVTFAWAMNLQGQLTTISAGGPPPSQVVPEAADWSLASAQMRRLLGSDTVPAARGWIYVDPRDENALLVAYGLPPLEADHVYQLWLVGEGERVSGGLFRVDQEGYGWLKVRSPRPFYNYQRVGITVEPRDGSAGPTGARVLGGDL